MADPAAFSPALNVPQSHELLPPPLRPANSRSHRGRPAGSKNKPKPPIIIVRETPGLLRAHALEIAPGCDVSASVANFSRRLRRSVCVLSGSGSVSNVTLRHASANSSVTFHGRFEILSLQGTFSPTAAAAFTGLTAFLSGAQGQMVGGKVAGALVAAGKVVLMAAAFANASFERLPAEDEEDGGGGGGLFNGRTRRREVAVRRPVKFEEEGGHCGVVCSAVAGGGTLPKEFCAWLPAGRQVGEK